jgi:predicted Fe-Mo cluster-binding NifX family protein
MKIAVPTNEEHNISNHFVHTKSFNIYTIEKGVLINEVYKYYNIQEAKNDPQVIYNSISDCKALIANNFETSNIEYLQKSGIEVVITDEKVLIQAVLNYYNEAKRLESNCCCCP